MTKTDKYNLVCAYKNAWIAVKGTSVDVDFENGNLYAIRKQRPSGSWSEPELITTSALIERLGILAGQLPARVNI
jgi:hypothetical protein